MSLDDTLTDEDFRRALLESYEEWFGVPAPAEPDLRVEGLGGSLLARVLAAFRRDKR